MKTCEIFISHFLYESKSLYYVHFYYSCLSSNWSGLTLPIFFFGLSFKTLKWVFFGYLGLSFVLYNSSLFKSRYSAFLLTLVLFFFKQLSVSGFPFRLSYNLTKDCTCLYHSIFHPFTIWAVTKYIPVLHFRKTWNLHL